MDEGSGIRVNVWFPALNANPPTNAVVLAVKVKFTKAGVLLKLGATQEVSVKIPR
jgi:hypothetical protein